MANSITNKNIVIDYYNTTNDYKISSYPSPSVAVADLRTTGYYLTADYPCDNKQIASVPLPIKMPDDTIIHSSHTDLLHNKDLPLQAREAHIFPDLKNRALLSIGIFCDNGCIAQFNEDRVIIVNKNSNKIIMKGGRDS